MSVDFARLNHILIPATKAGRDRFRRGPLGRALRPAFGVLAALSDEGRLLAVTSLLVGGLGLDVGSTDVYVLWSALFGILLGSLVLSRAHRLAGVRAEVSAPRRVTVGEEIRFAITLRHEGPRDHRAVRVRGPFLPWDGRWTGEEPRVRLLAAGKGARVEAAARFTSRGEHHLDPFTAAALVPLGLALGPPIETDGCRFLVVPRVARVTRLTLPIGRRHQPGGVPLASKTGESMDLLGVRPYRAGDPVRHLHARSWARAGAPVVREYQEEYFSRVGVVLEAGAADARQLEAALSLAAGVIAHLSRGEALIDLLVVGDRVHDLTIGRHLGFLEQALDLLACVEAGAPRALPDRLLARLAPHLARLSCVIVVAPSWDGGALSERIRGRGVGCTTLVVQRGEGGAADGARDTSERRDVRVLAASAIERGEPLSL
ncbi:MAG: DUF58 domain-containing protein [Polyangiaceae bacterium]|nr:DUF58 domain-containing protein [Polyangiaceae bacterium]